MSIVESTSACSAGAGASSVDGVSLSYGLKVLHIHSEMYTYHVEAVSFDSICWSVHEQSLLLVN